MNKRLTEDQFLDHIKKLTKAKTQAGLARDIQISPAYMSDVLNKRRPVSKQFAEKLSYKQITYYEVMK